MKLNIKNINITDINIQAILNTNGNLASNQIEVFVPGYKIFKSYNTNIVIKDLKNNVVYLDEKYYNYSKTTSKYRNLFLQCTSKEVEQRIKSGEYILTDLN